jgi:hypothetical protein
MTFSLQKPEFCGNIMNRLSSCLTEDMIEAHRCREVVLRSGNPTEHMNAVEEKMLFFMLNRAIDILVNNTSKRTSIELDFRLNTVYVTRNVF